MDTPSYPMAEVNLRKHKLKEFLSFTQKTKTTTIRKVVVFSMLMQTIIYRSFFSYIPLIETAPGFLQGLLQ
jgi:hypothetical protein